MEVLFVGQRKIQTVAVSSAFILALQKIRYHHSLTSECQRRKGTMTSRHYGISIPVYFLGTNVRWGKGKSWEEESKNEQQNSLHWSLQKAVVPKSMHDLSVTWHCLGIVHNNCLIFFHLFWKFSLNCKGQVGLSPSYTSELTRKCSDDHPFGESITFR